MTNGTKVKKRDGRIEPLDLEKMHLMVEEATRGLAGVSASQVEIHLPPVMGSKRSKKVQHVLTETTFSSRRRQRLA